MTEFNSSAPFKLFRRNRPNFDQLAQIAIGILSPIAIILIGAGDPRGFVVGLISQPFWIYATARAGQRYMLGVSILYLFVWISGIAHNFPALVA